MPIKVGITGGIGSGKSTVCQIFSTLGIPVFDADSETKRLMITHKGLVAAIRAEFGEEAYYHDGTLNRGYLASQVFNDGQRLEKLNKLVHPVAIQAGEEWARRQEGPYSIKEAALLFESGSFELNDYTVLVTAPEAVRVGRVVQRDGITAEQVRARIQRQWTDEKKARLADFIIINDGKQALIPQVLELDRFFRTKQS
ncbi:dephospho-CoA kinase [Parapedobacter soli]|uniref:dephospho-CoA kinase n=1 Tax=Parapedobacter soli TaxID=416955 RepID=UPI0021C8D5ED|nr:dephospho-CoA kinase [Parapedobacter soli]